MAGEDRWTTIVCENDDQWRALCGLAEFSDEFTTLDAAGRKEREDEIEDLIAAWTADQDGHDLETRLQELGVACHRAQNSRELAIDPQLAHREHFVNGDHADHGSMWVEGSRFKLSRTPSEITRAGPTLGENTFDVLLEVLGYDDDRLSELAVSGVLE